MRLYVFIGSYNKEDGNRTSSVLGVYSEKEDAHRAAIKFMDLSKDDEKYCARGTTISDHTLDSGWFEEYWKDEQ